VQLPTLGSTLVRCPSPAGFCNVRRVALYWLPALPPHRFYGRGVFLVVTLPWNQGSTVFPRGVGCLSRVLGLRLRPLAPSPTWPLQEGTRPFQSRGSASRGVLAPTNAFTPGAPFTPRASSRSHVRDGGFHAPAGAVLRVLAPLDGSGSSRLAREPCGPRRSPWPPTLRGLFSYRSRSWSVPPELSLPEEPYPLSRAVASLRVHARLPPAQYSADSSRPLSPSLFSRQLFALSNPPEGGPGTHEPGRRFLAVASPVASARFRVPHVLSPSHGYWARRLAAGTPASKLCSPRESVLRRPQPWPD